MKRLLSVLLTLIIAGSFVACSSQNSNDTGNTETSETTTQMVDESLINVEFTAPASFFSDDNPATDELTQEQKDKGIKSAKINDDGSVTYTMSKKDFKTFKEETKKSIEDSLSNIPSDYTCVKSVDYNDDFSKITLNVNRSEYSDGMNFFAVYSAGLYDQMYQAYTGTPQDKLSVTVTVVDENGNEIETGTYPTTD